MNEVLDKAIRDFKKAEIAFTKFITANDTGSTGSHQSGFHIQKEAWSLFLDSPGSKGSNKDIFVTIKWQDDFETNSRFIYYGTLSRNEYRLTRFGRGFPFLDDDNVGDLLIICKAGNLFYKAYVLSEDEDIENFLSGAGLSITETNRIIKKERKLSASEVLNEYIVEITRQIEDNFPASKYISESAELIYFKANLIHADLAIKQPDKIIIDFIDTEYQLFKSIENKLYNKHITKGFNNLDALISVANTVLNRRKSRAGKALENHLSSVFDFNKIQYETQVTTEEKKKPDFIFPDGKAYHDHNFNSRNLFFMGAKTTCKDRWRQILNEADRIKTKHLMTLQQGISKNQLQEMKKHNVVLVVPESYWSSFPKEYRDDILSLYQFMQMVRKSQS